MLIHCVSGISCAFFARRLQHATCRQWVRAVRRRLTWSHDEKWPTVSGALVQVVDCCKANIARIGLQFILHILFLINLVCTLTVEDL